MLPQLECFTITETAKLLGIHERNVRELIRTEQLKTVVINNKVKVTKGSMDELLPGFKNDPNPDQEIKKQRHPVKKDRVEGERRKIFQRKVTQQY